MVAAQLVRHLLEDDELDPKDFVENPNLPKEITIVGRRWFRPTYGGTYHTADIRVNGQTVARTPREYGYDQQYLETGWAWLENNAYIPKRPPGSSESPWRHAEQLGIELNYYAIDVKRQRDL